jgi:hypothetical protein
MDSYDNTIVAVRNACARIRMRFSTAGDGRLCSAADEEKYLELLKAELGAGHVVEIAPPRHWADVTINGIPFNLKLTSCSSADNSLNKRAIVFTLTGKSVKDDMNFKDILAHLEPSLWKPVRNKATEYHYIVVNKATGDALVKSILDIHTYVPNAALSNVLQINWKNEFLNRDHFIRDEEFHEQGRKLLRTLQTAIRRAVANLTDFANAEF